MAGSEDPKVSKTAFVLKMENVPAKEVVAAAAKRGIELSDRYVYVIRSNAKSKGRRKSKRSGSRGSSTEEALRRAIAELGLSRARQVFAEVERAFAAG